MIRLLIISIFLSLSSTIAECADYYFDSSVSNYTTCSQASPCTDFPGTTLDAAGTITCGDTLNFKRGSTFVGTAGHLILNMGTTACSSNHITLQAYGTGANPIFAADGVYGGTWTNLSGNIYYTDTGNTNPKGYVLEDDLIGLHIWSIANNTVPAGAFCPSSSTVAGTACNTTGQYVFINLSDGTDPTGQTIRVGNFVVTDTNRGFIRGAIGSNAPTYGHYLDFKDLQIFGSSGQQISPTGSNNRLIGIHGLGARKDGLMAMKYAPGSQDADGMTDYYGFYEYAAAGGSGFGQGITVYAPNVTLVGTFSQNNGMSGLDVLDYGVDVEPDNFVSLRIVSNRNARSPKSNSFDPLIYVDGADHWLIWGSHIYDVGITGVSGQLNSRQGFKFGSEHPSTEIVTDGYFINNFIMGSHSFGIKGYNQNEGTPSNIEDIYFQYNTVFSNAGTSGDRNHNFQYLKDEADQLHLINNIFVGNSGTVLDDSAYAGQALNSDYNMYYRRSQAADTTNIYTSSSTSYSLAGWRTLTSEDANSIYDDPEITTDSGTAPDVHLAGTSPAINAASLADACGISALTWVPQTVRDDIGANCVRGIAQSDGTVDDVSVSPDLGFHFSAAQLVSANIEPASLNTEAVGNINVSFIIPDKVTALLYDWTIRIILPAGFTINSGGTTAISNIQGFDGTTTVSVSGQNIDIARVGDGTSTFPTTVSFTLSQIKNPSSSGSGGAYSIKIVDTRDGSTVQEPDTQSIQSCNGIFESGLGCIQAQDTSVGADVFISPPPSQHASVSGHFQCSSARIS